MLSFTPIDLVTFNFLSVVKLYNIKSRTFGIVKYNLLFIFYQIMLFISTSIQFGCFFLPNTFQVIFYKIFKAKFCDALLFNW